MTKIVCLGTMHTYGGTKTEPYQFSDTWPGQLSKFLDNQTIDNYVYNAGESGYSIDYYPYKILNFYNEYKPDLFIVEMPIVDKIDIEISSAISNTFINQQTDYHPIYSRQRVLTKDWKKGETHAWPNRISITKHEAIDLFISQNDNINFKSLFKGYETGTVKSIESGEGLGDHEKQNVLDKINKLQNVLSDVDIERLKIYFYFRSLFMDESDTDTILFMNNILNILNTCLRLNVKILFFNVNKPSFIDHYIYKESYKSLIGNDAFWLTNIEWYLKKQNPESNDGMYFTPAVWKHFVEQRLGTRVVDLLK